MLKFVVLQYYAKKMSVGCCVFWKGDRGDAAVVCHPAVPGSLQLAFGYKQLNTAFAQIQIFT